MILTIYFYGMACFVIMMTWSVFFGRKARRNQWSLNKIQDEHTELGPLSFICQGIALLIASIVWPYAFSRLVRWRSRRTYRYWRRRWSLRHV